MTGVFDHITGRDVAPDVQIAVAHGERLVFGTERNKGLRLDPVSLSLNVITIGEDGIGETDILVHDETNKVMASLLAAMEPPRFPTAMGVIYCDPAAPYEENVHKQIEDTAEKNPPVDLNALFRKGRTWRVDA